MKPINHRLIGDRGENLACRFFADRGFIVVDHNFRSRRGEIDLVLRRDQAFRFVEVKYRRSLGFGLPQAAVNQAKQQKIRQAALLWLRRRHLPLDAEIHFDVLAILEIRGLAEFEYLEDAF